MTARGRPIRPAGQAPAGQAPLAELSAAVEMRRRASREVERAIARAFAAGYGYAEVGQLLGLSRSTTYSRFGHLMPAERWRWRR